MLAYEAADPQSADSQCLSLRTCDGSCTFQHINEGKSSSSQLLSESIEVSTAQRTPCSTQRQDQHRTRSSVVLHKFTAHSADKHSQHDSRCSGQGQEQFVGSMHALDFERAGEAELPKYSSDRLERVRSFHGKQAACNCLGQSVACFCIASWHRFANTVQLLTTSCADIIFEHGVPFYMKIDVEDATKTCLDSLGRVADSLRPQLISAEHLGFECASCWGQAVRMSNKLLGVMGHNHAWLLCLRIEDASTLMRLAALGYESFKIVRQSPHGFLNLAQS